MRKRKILEENLLLRSEIDRLRGKLVSYRGQVDLLLASVRDLVDNAEEPKKTERMKVVGSLKAHVDSVAAIHIELGAVTSLAAEVGRPQHVATTLRAVISSLTLAGVTAAGLSTIGFLADIRSLTADTSERVDRLVELNQNLQVDCGNVVVRIDAGELGFPPSADREPETSGDNDDEPFEDSKDEADDDFASDLVADGDFITLDALEQGLWVLDHEMAEVNERVREWHETFNLAQLDEGDRTSDANVGSSVSDDVEWLQNEAAQLRWELNEMAYRLAGLDQERLSALDDLASSPQPNADVSLLSVDNDRRIASMKSEIDNLEGSLEEMERAAADLKFDPSLSDLGDP